jgi:surface antigen
MKLKTLSAVVAIVLLTAACAEGGYGPKQTVGGLGGAAAGGLIGAQFGSGSGKVAATVAGVLIGGLIGSEIGRQMDEADRIRANAAINRAHTAPLGQSITWNNPQTGNHGSVTPLREGTSSSGAYCREFQQTIVVGGRSEQGYGTACRQPDGSWKITQ